MDKAKDAAMKAWPKRKDGRLKDYVCTDDDVRKLYAQGYRKAEKDNALTWEDASVIVTIAMDIIGEGEIHGEQNIYTEVLKRFNEQRTK